MGLKHKSKRNPVVVDGPWIATPLVLLRSTAFASLSPLATKLFLDLMSQLQVNADRNGDLCAAPAVMRPRGWASTASLRAAVGELMDADLLIVTRQGGRHKATLYALTPWPIKAERRDLDVGPKASTVRDWRGSGNVDPPTSERPAVWNRPRRCKVPSPAADQPQGRMGSPRASHRTGRQRTALAAGPIHGSRSIPLDPLRDTSIDKPSVGLYSVSSTGQTTRESDVVVHLADRIAGKRASGDAEQVGSEHSREPAAHDSRERRDRSALARSRSQSRTSLDGTARPDSSISKSTTRRQR